LQLSLPASITNVSTQGCLFGFSMFMCISWFKCIYLCILGAYAQYSDDILPSFWVQWDGLDDSNDDGPVGKRVLPPFERKPHPSPTCAHKVRKKWTEMEEKTLLEGVAK
jgi:hypothetical protein